MKTKFYILTTIVLICMISIAITYLKQVESQKLRSSFTRHFGAVVALRTHRDLESSEFYIAGIDSSRLYLAGKDPLLVKSYDTESLEERNAHKIMLENSSEVRSSQIMVDSLNVYLLDLKTNRVYDGDHNFQLKPGFSNTYATVEMVPIHQKSFVIRTLKENAKEFTLAKIAGDPPVLHRAPYLLQNQVDGMFSTDGKLHYVPKLHSLVYIYLYRNEFMRFDTAMHLTYRNHTIDSFGHARLHVTMNTVKKTLVLAQPPSIVNPKSYVDGSTLFVNSNVIGMHENEDKFYNSSAIDTYDIDTGTYRYSFYIPRFRGLSIKDFVVYHHMIYVIYNHYLVCYSLNMN